MTGHSDNSGNGGTRRALRPDTGDNRSLPCVTCGTTTPDASYCCGLPYCDNCRNDHTCDDDSSQPGQGEGGQP